MFSGTSRCCQVLPGISRCDQVFQVLTGISMCCQVLPGIYSCCQVYPGVARYLQVLSGTSRWPSSLGIGGLSRDEARLVRRSRDRGGNGRHQARYDCHGGLSSTSYFGIFVQFAYL